jgi:hypothetical protein
VIVRYPIGRAAHFPSAVRDAVVGEGASTAVLRWQVPETDAPGPGDAPPTLEHYRIERQATAPSMWLPIGPDVTFAVSGTGADRTVTALLGDIPSDARHRFRITPRGTVDGPSVIVESVAKGGDTVALVGDDVVHTFTTVTSVAVAGVGDTGGVTCAATGVEHTLLLGAARNVQHLIVAGGGGGGSDNAGGGGGGGVLSGTVLRAAGPSTVVVGGGGLASGINNENLQTNGCDSEVFGLKALGGGQGGNGQSGAREATVGGSGGGGDGERPTFGALGTAGQGSGGGRGIRSTTVAHSGAGGGGGGAGALGIDAGGSTVPGAGGVGLPSNISGQPSFYGSGGGGGVHRSSSDARRSGEGGTRDGGGGGGALGDVDSSDGEDGFGGGGGGSATTSRSGGAGGSGTVILRYPFAP